ESGTFSSARPRDSRKRAAGHHVTPGRLAPAFLHGNARHIEHDRREPHGAHAHAARNRLRLGDQGVSGRPASHNLFPHSPGPQSLHHLHQPAGTNRSADQIREMNFLNAHEYLWSFTLHYKAKSDEHPSDGSATRRRLEPMIAYVRTAVDLER